MTLQEYVRENEKLAIQEELRRRKEFDEASRTLKKEREEEDRKAKALLRYFYHFWSLL